MKLKKFILPMLTLVLLASGCTKEYVYNGSQVQTIRFNITPSEWRLNEGQYKPGANNYLYCTKDIPAINSEVFNYGNVQAYVWNVYDGQNNLGAWNTLPFVYPLEVYVNNDDGTQSMVIIPENLRFEWELGKVTFIIQDLDGYDPLALGDGQTLSFKVSISHNM
jgi:hypothetical protein